MEGLGIAEGRELPPGLSLFTRCSESGSTPRGPDGQWGRKGPVWVEGRLTRQQVGLVVTLQQQDELQHKLWGAAQEGLQQA